MWPFRGPSKLGDIVHKAVIANTRVPPGYTVKTGSNYFHISSEQRGEIVLVMILSLVLIYMVTAALFESLEDRRRLRRVVAASWPDRTASAADLDVGPLRQ